MFKLYQVKVVDKASDEVMAQQLMCLEEAQTLLYTAYNSYFNEGKLPMSRKFFNASSFSDMPVSGKTSWVANHKCEQTLLITEFKHPEEYPYDKTY